MNKWHPTRQEILTLFEYEPKKGLLIWKNPPEPNRKRLLGKVAGTVDRNGYRIVMINKKCFKVHRIVWFLEKGSWSELLDHRDGNQLNNKIENLKSCDHRKNMQNMWKHRNGKLLGSSWHKSTQSWRSVIVHNGKQRHLGNFSTEAEAHHAYLLKHFELFGAFPS